MQVSVDTDMCAATGGCTQVAPEVFEIRSDGVVHVINAQPGPELHDAVREAADLCPTGAITVDS